jgi:rhamnosyl/mannosyltransferase
VIPFGLDVHPAPAPDGHPAVASVRARWSGPIALFVGRLVPYKGVEFLLRALTESDVAAVVIGDGPLREPLEELAASLGVDSRAFFLGAVDDGALSAWYGACDLLVLPSITRAEAFGLVQLEAMARGKPVISTRIETGVPWVNIDGYTGLTVPPSNPGALAAALRTLAGDLALRRRMGANARDRFTMEFTAESMIDRTAGMYEQIMREPVSSPPPILKRLFDAALSGAGLVVSAPVWALAAAAIKLEDGGPVFFRQARVGQNGASSPSSSSDRWWRMPSATTARGRPRRATRA